MHDFFKWSKIDLHFHTPISNKTKNDYKNANVNSEDIVKKLIEFDVKMVAVTDHNIFDINQFNQLNLVAKSKIVFLPGVELKVDGYDVVLIIDPKNDLEKFDGKILEFCNENRKSGRNDSENLVKCFKDFNYIIIPEYNRSHGGDKVHKHGTIENDIFKLKIICGFFNAVDIKNVKRGKNSTIEYIKKALEYANTSNEIPSIFVSDNHDIAYYPGKNEVHNNFNGWTYINSECSFEGLMFSLSDPESRIFVTENIDQSPSYLNHRDDFLIEKIIIKNMDDKSENEIILSPYLNVMIGDRSTGKSFLAKKIVAKFDKNADKKFSEEYGDLWKKYKIKIYFKNVLGTHLDYEQISNNDKTIYLEQNHIISELEKNEENLYKNWYDVLNISSPIIDEKRVELEIIKIQKNIKSYLKVILEIKNDLKKLHYKNNFFNLSIDIINKKSEKEISFNLNLIKLNIEEWINTNKDDAYIENKIIEIKNLKFKSPYISKENSDRINKNISEILNILSFSQELKNKIENSLDKSLSKNKEILLQQKNHGTQINDAINEVTRLKKEFKKLGKRLKELMLLKNLVLDDQTGLFIEDKIIIPFRSKNESWTFIKDKEILLNNLTISNGIAKIMLSETYSEKGKFNILKNLSNLIFAKDNEIFKQNRKKIDDIYFCEVKNVIDILDPLGESYRKTSPGGKASLILQMLLNKEKIKNRIVIIDQPEDSLDNSTVTNWLVNAIRDIKFNNQLIIISHNANIAINGDAQNLILSLNKQKNKISYLANSFESNEKHKLDEQEKTIFEKAVSTLEGGKIEIHKRINKWNISLLERVDINDIKSKMMPRKQEDFN